MLPETHWNSFEAPPEVGLLRGQGLLPEQDTQLLFLEQTLICPPLEGSHKPPGLKQAPLSAIQKSELSTHAPALPVVEGQTTLGAGQAEDDAGAGAAAGV